jgi:predicted Zn-dependent protease with MMP-like domain
MRSDPFDRFDVLLEDVLASLPAPIRNLLDQAPLIVDDEPDPKLLREMGIDPGEEDLCGLHSGTPLTERTYAEGADLPETIHLFRGPIIEQSGWQSPRDDRLLREEIRVTLLHEIGHHFGLDEGDLEGLGYA